MQVGETGTVFLLAHGGLWSNLWKYRSEKRLICVTGSFHISMPSYTYLFLLGMNIECVIEPFHSLHGL